jgi:hypothetical protein
VFEAITSFTTGAKKFGSTEKFAVMFLSVAELKLKVGEVLADIDQPSNLKPYFEAAVSSTGTLLK